MFLLDLSIIHTLQSMLWGLILMNFYIFPIFYDTPIKFGVRRARFENRTHSLIALYYGSSLRRQIFLYGVYRIHP